MAVNRGKDFEERIKESFLKLPHTYVQRLYDSTSGFVGVHTPCDFLIYKLPILFCIECKSCHGNTLPWSNITDNQWKELIELDSIPGVVAGYMIWFVDRDITVFVPATEMSRYRECGKKSFNVKDFNKVCSCIIQGKKKRVFFDYDMTSFYRYALIWANKEER
jgi:penicillin-binding protein-related factor A (putative recombinase)